MQGHDGYEVCSSAEQSAVKAQNISTLKSVLLADFLRHEHHLTVKPEELRRGESPRVHLEMLYTELFSAFLCLMSFSVCMTPTQSTRGESPL